MCLRKKIQRIVVERTLYVSRISRAFLTILPSNLVAFVKPSTLVTTLPVLVAAFDNRRPRLDLGQPREARCKTVIFSAWKNVGYCGEKKRAARITALAA